MKEFAVGGSHQIDGLGGAASEDDLLLRRRIDEAAHPLAGLLQQVGGLLRKVVYAAVHIGIGRIVLLTLRLHHAARFLGGGGIVEIYQWATIDLGGQYGKLGTYIVDVKHCR